MRKAEAQVLLLSQYAEIKNEIKNAATAAHCMLVVIDRLNVKPIQKRGSLHSGPRDNGFSNAVQAVFTKILSGELTPEDRLTTLTKVADKMFDFGPDYMVLKAIIMEAWLACMGKMYHRDVEFFTYDLQGVQMSDGSLIGVRCPIMGGRHQQSGRDLVTLELMPEGKARLWMLGA